MQHGEPVGGLQGCVEKLRGTVGGGRSDRLFLAGIHFQSQLEKAPVFEGIYINLREGRSCGQSGGKGGERKLHFRRYSFLFKPILFL